MSDSVRPHRRQPTRLPCPWDSPGKNNGVGCYFLLQCMKVKSESEVAQSCLTLCNPTDCSPPGSSVHGVFQARVLEWGTIAFSVGRHSGGKEAHGKMLHITKGKWKGKQQGDTTQHLSERPDSRTLTAPSAGGLRATWTLFHGYWECKMVQPLQKTVSCFFTKLNIILPYNPATALPDIYPKELRNLCPTISCMQILYQLYSQLPKLGNNQDILGWVNGSLW